MIHPITIATMNAPAQPDPQPQVAGPPQKRRLFGWPRIGRPWWLAMLVLATVAVLFLPAIVRAVKAQFGSPEDSDTNTLSGYTWFDGPALIPGTFNGMPVTRFGNGTTTNSTIRGSIAIDASITNIGEGTFANFPGLTSVMIPESVTYIGPGAFAACSDLTSIQVDLRNPAYSSVGGVLFNKSRTTLVVFPGAKAGAYAVPAGVTNIEDWAFEYCTSLTSITIPKSVVSIGNCAFFGCGSLTNVTMGSNVTIGADAFLSCPKLAKSKGGRSPDLLPPAQPATNRMARLR